MIVRIRNWNWPVPVIDLNRSTKLQLLTLLSCLERCQLVALAWVLPLSCLQNCWWLNNLLGRDRHKDFLFAIWILRLLYHWLTTSICLSRMYQSLTLVVPLAVRGTILVHTYRNIYNVRHRKLMFLLDWLLSSMLILLFIVESVVDLLDKPLAFYCYFIGSIIDKGIWLFWPRTVPPLLIKSLSRGLICCSFADDFLSGRAVLFPLLTPVFPLLPFGLPFRFTPIWEFLNSEPIVGFTFIGSINLLSLNFLSAMWLDDSYFLPCEPGGGRTPGPPPPIVPFIRD